MARIARVVDITPRAGAWPNILDATIPGVPNVQVARVIASCGHREERIAIVLPQPGQRVDRAGVLTAVRAYLTGFTLAFVTSDQTGIVNLWIAEESSNDLVFLAAASAAKLQISWAWDDSPNIRVNVGDQSFYFEVQHIGERSHEVVERTAA